jgi:ankyrin repeat protein
VLPGLPPLLAAVSNPGETTADEIRELLKSGADPRAVDDTGRTALHIAAREVTGGNDEDAFGIFNALIEGGVPTDARDADGATAFDIAAFAGNDAGEITLARPAESRAAASSGTLLLYAARHLDEVMTREVLSGGAPADSRDGLKRTPLLRAASTWRGGWTEGERGPACRIASMLLAAGADVNARDYEGGTALYRGAGDVNMVRLLLDAGSDPNAVAMGRTALIAALSIPGEHAIESVRLLLARGADPRESDGPPYRMPALRFALQGSYPKPDAESTTLPEAVAVIVSAGGGAGDDLVMASKNGVTVLVEALLTAGVSPNDKGGWLSPALMMAVEAGHVATARLLVERGADLNVQRDDGKPLVDVAQETCGPEFANWLRERVVSGR